MGAPTALWKRKRYFRLRAEGAGVSEAAREVGISRTTAYRLEDDAKKETPNSSREMRLFRQSYEDQISPEPVDRDGLCDEAARALDDFDYFRRRYFGRVATPWQAEAAYDVVAWLASPDKEYVVLNCPPGSGKSTLWHDICCWLICRDRTIRILWGSRTFRQASQYTNRIRRSLERHNPVAVDPEAIDRGLATQAEGVLSIDYGRFKPLAHSEMWRREEAVVAQIDDVSIEDKEATFSAFGMDSGFLGGRYDFIIWDDLVDNTTVRTPTAREEQQKWWDEEAESRLDPGGALVLNGQRLAPLDLYRYVLDITVPDDPDGDPDDPAAQRHPKYRHVIYRAHYEDRCTPDHHRRDAAAYPAGCLLDPQRLPWRELRTISSSRHERYRILYQQEDVDPSRVLVQKVWIDGGRDEHGFEHPGCWDKDRGACEIPDGLTGRLISYATVDPSPSKFWAIQWWLYHPDSNQRFLMDLVRQSMQSGEFLDWSYSTGGFVGLAESWQQRSKDLKHPIGVWIVERNAAQRFLLAYDHVQRWQSVHRVDIISHDTARNKLDPDLGVQMLGGLYEHGLVRLPGKGEGRLASLKLIDEVTLYPDSGTTDCVMAQWFGEYHLPNMASRGLKVPRQRRPSWMKHANGYPHRRRGAA